MYKPKELPIILTIVGVVGFLSGVWLCETMTANRMMKQSLLGYKAAASYSTNEFGEIKILKIEWKNNENRTRY